MTYKRNHTQWHLSCWLSIYIILRKKNMLNNQSSMKIMKLSFIPLHSNAKCTRIIFGSCMPGLIAGQPKISRTNDMYYSFPGKKKSTLLAWSLSTIVYVCDWSISFLILMLLRSWNMILFHFFSNKIIGLFIHQNI